MVTPSTMFRGKLLWPYWMRCHVRDYRALVAEHGREKVDAVYDYFYGFLTKMQWGQWMVLQKVCPDRAMRPLFYWVLECIYQSDLVSDLHFEYLPIEGDPERQEVRIVVTEPDEERRQRLTPWLGTQRRYSFIDWYGRFRRDPHTMPELDARLFFDEPSEETGARSEEYAENPDSAED